MGYNISRGQLSVKYSVPGSHGAPRGRHQACTWSGARDPSQDKHSEAYGGERVGILPVWHHPLPQALMGIHLTNSRRFRHQQLTQGIPLIQIIADLLSRTPWQDGEKCSPQLSCILIPPPPLPQL